MADVTTSESISDLLDRLCEIVPDYPQPGISFKDLTPVFADPVGLRRMVDELIAPFEGQFDIVAGLEARGFVLAAAAAYASGKGMLTIRKAGKLPREVYRDEYTLEYGTSCLEVHKDEIAPGTRVLILDDVLATGGTVGSAVRLLQQTGAKIAGVGVVLELDGLGGRAKLPGQQVVSLQVVHS
ncbi:MULTISPECIES: adenine phosphoribosyltransferase [Glutamicibacter]|uniref:Adenine phosphoribosyltransferase n=1 Tax=Glutamicibacter nicotianae TaxID=37929 RepID=A0ABQ0RLH9_GLUNI|nr:MULTISPECIES: adenine phosphoribosyltransferase [Glutamicibacter]QEP06778.1 adenine phosphoribosyltransferase [Glutamicibacter sp. ZJUTW]UTM47793.1 adenine phosphoribosyltransferase [Glutamicibacter mysorens]WIV45105.1 adenine phosphoribosyltransferase [Glutamicibacter nicotianae]GEC12679.1 adenine phosphoribosyltransferase [Glutamicibacter nicotianae]